MNIKCDHETRSEEWKLPPHDISILWRVNYDIFMAVKILFFLYEISKHSSKFIDTLIWRMILFSIMLLQITRYDLKKIEYIYKFITSINVIKNVRKYSIQNYAISYIIFFKSTYERDKEKIFLPLSFSLLFSLNIKTLYI